MPIYFTAFHKQTDDLSVGFHLHGQLAGWVKPNSTPTQPNSSHTPCGCIIHRIAVCSICIDFECRLPFKCLLFRLYEHTHTHTLIHTHTHGHICVDRELRSDFALTLARFNAFSARSEDNSRATCGFFKVCFYPQLTDMEVEQEG